MLTLSVALTEAEYKGLEYAAMSPQEWADNVVRDRARIAVDEIVQISVRMCLEQGIQVPGSKEAIVDLAFLQGWVKTAAERHTNSTPSS
jgi:hypothetical protein